MDTMDTNMDTNTSKVELYVENYMKNMDEREKKAYKIAMSHLKSSFNILRSNGFKEYRESAEGGTK
jgi:hypothetical protein